MTEAKMAEITAKMFLPAGIDGENRKAFEKLMDNLDKTLFRTNAGTRY